MVKKQIKHILKQLFNIDIKRYDPNGNHQFLNEAIHFEKEVIFIAVPKTGSTSVRSQLAQKGKPFIENPHLNIVQVRDLIYPFLLKQNLGRNERFPSENRISDTELRNQSKQIFNSFFKFAAVRNPWARAVSLYHRREGISTKDKMSFDTFCESHLFASDTCSHPTLHRNQLDWLCDTDGTILMDYIYKVEEFEKAIVEIEKNTNGRLVLNNIQLNVNPSSKSKSYQSYYTSNTKELIANRFEKDIDYFKYTF